MPGLKVKSSNGKWLDIASADSHEHTIDDIIGLPGNIANEVADLKEKIGNQSVAYQINAAIGGVNPRHPSTHPASMITGLSAVATSGSFNDLKDVPANLGGGVGAGLPDITDEDEGKVLGVLDGEWTKIDAPGAGITSSSTDILPATDLVLTPVAEGPTSYDGKKIYINESTDTDMLSACEKIAAGKEYCFVVNGAEYTCTAMNFNQFSELIPEYPVVPEVTINNFAFCGNICLAAEGHDDLDNSLPFAFEFLDNDRVIDGETVKEKAVYFATVSDEDVSEITCNLRIYEKVNSISWNEITNKPFYEKTYKIVIDESTVTDVTFSGLGFAWKKVSPDTLPEGTVVGGTISMNGMSIVISRDDVIAENEHGIGCLLLGQFPFLMVYKPGETTLTALGRTETVNIPETGTYMLGVGEGGSYTFESKEIKKLNNKFLGILEGEDSEEMDIFPKQTVTWENAQDSSSFEIQECPQLNKKYIVEFDGTEYECVAWLGEGICLGNTRSMGESYPDSGEPFLAASIPDDGKIAMVFILPESATETHEIRVYKPATKAMVKGEHIPFVKHTPYSEEEVLPINEYGPLTYSDTYKLYKIDVESDFVLKAGVEYTVTWDNAVYVCEGQDCSSVMTGAVAIGNGTDFGYKGNNEPFIILTANGFLSVCAVNDTAENYHTVRVRIVTKEKDEAKPGFVSWDAIEDRPFGEKPVVIFEGEFQNTLVDNDGDGTNDAWNDEPMSIVDTSEVTLEEGKRYVVTWEGKEYELECYLAEGIVPYVGNTALVGLEDNGVPFAIARDTVGLTGGTPKWIAMVNPVPTDLTISGLYSCKIVGEKIEKIPEIYQNQTDWDEKDEKSAAFLNNKPFGEMVSAGSVLTDTMAGYDSDDFGLILTDINTGKSLLKDEYFQIGGKYIVEINGHVLVGTGVDGTTITNLINLPSDVFIKGGIVTLNDFDDNGNYHTVVVVGFANILNFIDTAYDSEFTNDESYPVKISVLNCIKKIDQKFLPYGSDHTVKDKITSFNAEKNSTESDVALEEAGLYGYDYTIESTDNYWTETKFTIGEKYILQIGEQSYCAEAKREEGDWELYFGNLAFVQKVAEIEGITGVTVPDTGEDFLIIAYQTNDTPNGGFSILGYTDYGDSVSVTMYSGAEIVTKIDKKYIPDPPEFDLTAMGLPNIPLDGTAVNVSCDTTELRNALSKSVVKIHFTANGESVSGILNAMIGEGIYNGGFVTLDTSTNTPIMFNLSVGDGFLYGMVIRFAVAT